MSDFDWQAEVRRWLPSHYDVSPDLANSIIAFFEHAFKKTRYPQRAWFGTHSSGISLVIGGIYLAAIHRIGQDRGFWLLLDQNPPPIDDIEYRSVQSTQGSRYPLVWAHSSSLSVIPSLIGNVPFWDSFGSASEKILYSPRIASDRDSVQKRRKKKRLSEFWGIGVNTLFPDEVEEGETLREGAKRTIIVNAYERDEKARKRCIQHYGSNCFICGFSFGQVYGKIAGGYIHVHHLRPLSEIGEEYTIDPVEDLRPVCPNCHAVLHLRKPAFSIQEVMEFLQ